MDQNKVKLVAITKPVIDGINTTEELIAYCARVSNPKNQYNNETSHKLLKYCIDNKHWSIFEMVSVTLEIETTRDIGRQILRHRSFSFQEFSQRYAKVDTGTFTFREARLQDTKNRQNSIEVADEDSTLEADWEFVQNEVLRAVEAAYEWALDKGIAKEQARVVLPEGLTMSRMYMAGNLRSWIHYCELRRGNGTQKEHRDIAEKCWKILQNEFPFLKEFE